MWKADFRTATFLKREGDSFEFGHRSLFEYFLARHRYRALSTSDFDADAVAVPVPSPETLDFLGQSIAGDERYTVEALQQVAAEYVPAASEFAFAYALHAERKDYPGSALPGFDRTAAELDGWLIHCHGPPSWRTRASGGANLRNARFTRADLTGANLDDADLHNADSTTRR